MHESQGSPVFLTLTRGPTMPVVGERFKQSLSCMTPAAPAGSVTPSRFNLDVLDGRAVYNTSTGNYLVLSEEERRILDGSMAGAAIEATDAPLLYESGFLVDREIDEVEAVRRAFRIATGVRYSPHLTIAPTMDCNFGCNYCFEAHVKGAMAEHVQDDLVRFTRGLLEAAGPQPRLSVTWFGGEPLMAMNVINRLSGQFRTMVEARCATSYTADIITNGYALTTSVLQQLLDAQVNRIQVTLDGPAAIHNARRHLKTNAAETFDRIIRNVQLAAEHIDILIRVNVDRSNAESVPDLLAELDAAGLLPAVPVDVARVEAFSPNALSPDLFTAREFAIWRAALQVWAAERGLVLGNGKLGPRLVGVCQVDSINSFVIDHIGRLFKCWAELGTSAVPIGVVGDQDSWPSGAVGDLAARDPFDDPECLSCCLLPMCLGGSCPKTRQVGRQLDAPECPPFRHDIRERIMQQHGTRTAIINTVAKLKS